WATRAEIVFCGRSRGRGSSAGRLDGRGAVFVDAGVLFMPRRALICAAWVSFRSEGSSFCRRGTSHQKKRIRFEAIDGARSAPRLMRQGIPLPPPRGVLVEGGRTRAGGSLSAPR